MAELPNPLQIAGIDHVVLRVHNLPKMLAFYEGVLGCTIARGPLENGLIQLRAGAALIDLVPVDSPLGLAGGDPPDPMAPNCDHICLLIERWDSDAIHRYLQAAGMKVGPEAIRYGATGFGPSIYLADPEGNRLELKAALRA